MRTGRRVEAWGIVAVIAIGTLLATPTSAGELRDQLRLRLFDRINEIRVANELNPLAKDPTAFHVAQQHCVRQIFDGSFGHYASNGLAPYHRYSFDGGNDGILENTASWSSDEPYGEDEIWGLAERSLEAMLAEKPPSDGHRRAILDPYATHLGTGIAWRKGEVRIAQEFVRRYVEWASQPSRTAGPGDRIVIEGRPISGWHVAALSLHHESFPSVMRPSEASRIEKWELPADRVDFEPIRMDTASQIVRLTQASGGLPGDLIVSDDRSFTFSVPFTKGPGIYTVVVWVRQNGTDSALVSTSNISIRFDEAEASQGAR